MRWALTFFLALFSTTAYAIDDGSLLFIENGQNLVECYTKSAYSHVAIVLDGQVYEAEVPEIRKYTLDEWFTNVGKSNEGKGSPALVSVVAPDESYSSEELDQMRGYLEAQVGRRYSIRGYLRKIEGDGIHCSEMCAGAVEASGRHDFSTANCKLSPGDLHESLQGHHRVGNKLYAYIKKPYRRPATTRWKHWWQEKGEKCRWSCWETWTFCW